MEFTYLQNMTDEDDCFMIYKIPDELKCKFVKENGMCDKNDLMHSHYLLYCLMGNSVVAPFVLMVIIIILFTIVGMIADDYICPLMAALASLLRLSETVAGVTILALANGTPDLMSAMSSLEHNSPETMFCSLIGGGLIDTTLVVGTIILLERFKFQPIALVRDCGFYLFSVVLFFIFYYQEDWTLMNSMIFVVIYVIYAGAVLARYFYELAKTIALGLATDKSDIIIYELKKSKSVQEEKLIIHKELRTLWNDFWVHMTLEEGAVEDKHLLSKILKYMVAPISFTLKLVIPKFNFTIDNNGWSKSLYMTNAFLFPLVTVFCFNYLSIPEYLAECISVGLIFTITVYITTSRLEKPRYHNLIAMHVFFTSFSVVNVVVNSIISLLNAIASKFYISRTSLPLTVLAVGNTIGDFVTNVNLARSGLPRMAIAACYAGPLFNLVFDAGFTTIYVFLSQEKTSMKVRLGVMGPIGILFLFLVLVITMLILPLIYYDARKSFAIFLFIIYAQFIGYIILIETGVIYPLGERKFSTYDDTHYDDPRECDPVYSDCLV